MADDRIIVTTHLAATAPGGERYAMVTLNDGQYAITRDDQLVLGLQWPANQVSQCAAEFARLTELQP